MRLKSAFSAVTLAAIFAFSFPCQSHAAPNGKTSTAEIGAGAGILYSLVQYFVALSKSKGSAHQANEIVDTPLVAKWSLRSMRDLVIYDVAAAAGRSSSAEDTIRLWRLKFEHYRGCWNQVLTQPAGSGSAPSGAVESASAKDGNAKPLSTPKPAMPTPLPGKPCEALFQDYKEYLVPSDDKSPFPVLPFDLIDLTSALNDKSLYQQVLDQDVGSYATNNALRSLFLSYIGEHLVQDIHATTAKGRRAPGGPKFKDIQSLVTDCGSKPDPVGCIGDWISLQLIFSQQRSQHDACMFSSGMWMPSFTAIKATVSPIPPLGRDPNVKNSPPLPFPLPWDSGMDPSILNMQPIRPQKFPGSPPGC